MFVVHHVVAVLPYVIYLFTSNCALGSFILLLFLGVELSTIPLNTVATLEQLGYGHSRWHFVAFGFVYSTWLVVRVVMPGFLMQIIYTTFILQPNLPACLIPAILCAHIISIFCWYVCDWSRHGQ